MGLSAAIGLATSAGLNAYIPLLVYGVLARYTDYVNLPEGWMWLTDPILLAIVGILLIIEIIADKIPAVDSANDIIQTLVRPTSGGIVFASAFAEENLVSSSAIFQQTQTWVWIAVGFVVALVMHLVKTTARPVVNAGTVGTGTPVVSTAEDVVSASLAAAAIFAPFLVFIILAVFLVPVMWLITKMRGRRSKHKGDTIVH